MQWVQNIVLPLLIAVIPCLLTFLGTRSQIKADLQKNKDQLDAQTDKNHQEVLQAIKQHNKKQDEALKCLIRTDILNMYFKHQEVNSESLTQWESENLHKLYSSYCDLEGNSFVKDVVDRMNAWEITKN